MTTFLLLLSLILNAAAIFAIILLYLRQNRLVEAEKKQGKIISEMEEIFSAYLFELKEENDKFLELMANTNVQVQQDDAGKPVDEAADMGSFQSLDHSDDEVRLQRPGKGISYHAARQAYNKNSETINVPIEDTDEVDIDSTEPVISVPEANEMSFVEKVAAMRKQGLTIEEIARELDKGKTEIELLLKFRQNTQE